MNAMFENKALPILFEDDDFIAIHKPPGILVHRTKISEDTQFVLQLLRQQIKQRIYPIHRLDRGTSGVLLFGKHKKAASLMGAVFMNKEIQKQYIAIIRGYVEKKSTINYALAKEPHLPKKEAITHYQRLQQTELPVAISRYPSSRYSLVKVTLETGRRHQIRRHFSHLRHPIIGDKRHGDVKHNSYWRDHFGISRMLLHAQSLHFLHPISEKPLLITAAIDASFQAALDLLKFDIYK